MSLSLKAWRRARGVSQAEMAKHCKVAIPTYQRWEKNPGAIKINDAIRIADKLQISLDDIILRSNTTHGSMV